MIAHSFRKLADRSVASLGDLCGAESLPSLFNGRLIRLPRTAWKTVYDRYESYLARWIDYYLRPGQCFIDVGAHFGVWTAYAAKIVGSQGRVIAMEPSPAYATLALTARLNPNCRALRAGAGECEGALTFFAQGESKSGSFSREVTAINRAFQPEVAIVGEAVPVKTLDAIAGHDHRPNLVKVDVEGYEVQVLRGANELLARQTASWLVEIHPLQLKTQGFSEGQVFNLFADAGYGCEVIHRDECGTYTIRADIALSRSSS